jgi:hypothetical protein
MRAPLNCTFVPLEAPKVVWDTRLDSPVLLLGHWTLPTGLPFEAVVATMATVRPLSEIRDATGRQPRGAQPQPVREVLPGTEWWKD